MGKLMKVEDGLRKIILVELMLPTVLLIFGIYHGLLQVLYRAGIIRSQSFLGINYYQGLTLHGAINAVFFTTFFAIALGNGVVPYYLDRKICTKAAFISMLLMVGGMLTTAIAVFSGSASVLFTFYAPLVAHPAFYVGLVLFVIGSWVGFFNWIPAYRSYRRESVEKKAPLAVVLLFTAFIVWIFATIPIAIEILFQQLPLAMGWTREINVTLSRLLFWFFGHPLVYFWILPSYAMFYSMLPALAGGKIYSDFAGRLAAMTLLVFSAPVGLHHQFTEPTVGAGWKLLHGFFTFFVAIPSLMTVFSLAASLEIGGRARGGKGLFGWWKKLPYFDTERWLFGYFFAGLVVFIFGGITGIVNASYSINSVVHNTSWLPAHFHMTVGGPVFLSFIGMTLFMTSQLLGKEVAFKRLNVWIPYLFIMGECIFSSGLFFGGLHGEPRRTNMGLTYTNPTSPLFHPEWVLSTVIGAIGGTVMALAMLLYFVIFFKTAFGKRTQEPALEFPVSETFHDENVPAVRNFTPWLVGSAIAALIAYAIPISQTMSGSFGKALGYHTDNPLPISKSKAGK